MDEITVVDGGVQIDHEDGDITFVDNETLFSSGLDLDDLEHLRYDAIDHGLACERRDIYIQL